MASTTVDEKLLLPFTYGWVRKTAYRPRQSDGKSAGPVADICYISPDKKKLWARKKLMVYLEQNPQSGLSMENFSYVSRPLELNDPDKEIVYTKSSKDSAASPITSPPIIRKYTASRFIKSSIKSNITSTTFRPTRPLALKRKNKASDFKKKIRRRKIDLTRASTSTHVSSDVDVVSTSQEVAMEVVPPAAEVRNISSFHPNAMQNFINMYTGLEKVFSYLDTKDLLNAQRVCKTWEKVVLGLPSERVSVNGLKIINWEAFANFVKIKKALYLDMTGILGAEFIDWENVIPFLAKTNLREITYSNCTGVIAQQIIKSYMKFQLQFECESISVVLKKVISIDNQIYDRRHMTFTKVTFESDQGFNVTGHIASLLGLSSNFKRLNHLEIKSVKELSPYQLSADIKLVNSENTLRLVREEDNNRARIRFNMPEGIFNLKNIECLQLINLDVADNFHHMLRKCTRLKTLILNPVTYTVASQDKILEGILNVKEHLQSLTWALSIQRIRKAKSLLGKGCQGDDQSDTEFMPISEKISDLLSSSIDNSVISKEEVVESIEPKKISINFYPLEEVEKLIKNKVPNLEVSISKIDRFRSAATPDLHESLEHTSDYNNFTI